jgi:hypothetical protein
MHLCFRMNHRRTQSSGASSATATLSDMSCGFCRSGADCDIHGLAASTAASVVRRLRTSAVALMVDASFLAMAGVVVFHERRCFYLCADVLVCNGISRHGEVGGVAFARRLHACSSIKRARGWIVAQISGPLSGDGGEEEGDSGGEDDAKSPSPSTKDRHGVAGLESRILEFARSVMLCSARTVTGGDPFFAAELVRGASRLLGCAVWCREEVARMIQQALTGWPSVVECVASGRLRCVVVVLRWLDDRAW